MVQGYAKDFPAKHRLSGEDEGVHVPTPEELLARIRRIPAAAVVLERLDGLELPPVALVGGTVRDLLLDRVPLDLDIVVEGSPAAVVERLGGRPRRHERFGTAELAVAGRRVDVAAARRERYAHPGALPSVEPASLIEDLERRDFTINAIAVALTGAEPGRIVAAPQALDDLERRVLRILHPASFRDDPTRLFRLARYGARLGFVAEPETSLRAAEAVRSGGLETVSGTRVGNELRLLAREADPVRALAAVRELGLDRALEPGFGLTDDAWAARALELLGGEGRPDVLVLALAARRLEPTRAGALLDRLAFSASDREAIVAAGRRLPELAEALAAADRSSALDAAAAGWPAEAVALAGALGPADAAGRWLRTVRHVETAIDGADLLAAGVPTGPAVGRGLAAARAAALDGEAPDRDAQLAVALRAARDGPAEPSSLT
jgi:tRNA nucleotidyltransferase (CCA-adding enzyme)